MGRVGAASCVRSQAAGFPRDFVLVVTLGLRWSLAVTSDRLVRTVRYDKFWHDDVVAEPVGRRETGKRARRAALTAAAHRLFAERGYGATAVRGIAAAAGLTWQTFCRYSTARRARLLG